MSESPLLSIIIPTKDRYDTLIPVVDSFLNHIVGDDYEIVVQDNSGDNSQWKEYVIGGQDKKVKYFYDSVPVSAKDNVNRSFDNCLGEYWIFIGDDDFVSPYILDVVKDMQKKGIKSITYPRDSSAAIYWWKNVKFAKESQYKCKTGLRMPRKMDTSVVCRETKRELSDYCSRKNLTFVRLPQIYHGIVKCDVMKGIKKITGFYSTGPCLDVGLSVALAIVLNEHYYMNYPVSIVGISGKSTTGIATAIECAKLEDMPGLPTNINEIWNPNIPHYWSPRTVEYQTVFEMLQVFHFNKKIDLISCYVSILIGHRKEKQLIKETRTLLFFYLGFNLLKYLKFIYFLGRSLAKILVHRIFRSYLLEPVAILPTAEDVMKFLKRYPFSNIK